MSSWCSASFPKTSSPLCPQSQMYYCHPLKTPKQETLATVLNSSTGKQLYHIWICLPSKLMLQSHILPPPPHRLSPAPASLAACRLPPSFWLWLHCIVQSMDSPEPLQCTRHSPRALTKLRTNETQSRSSNSAEEPCGPIEKPCVHYTMWVGTFPLWNSVSPICKGLGPNDFLRSFQQKYSRILPLDPVPPGQKPCLIHL